MMRSYLSATLGRRLHLTAIFAVAMLGAGCSAEITRLDHPFFGKEKPAQFAGRPASQFTGSLPPKPHVPVSGRDEPAVPANAVTSAPMAPVRDGDQADMVITARQGDTVYELSRRYNVSARDILAANNMPENAQIVPGQQVRIPLAQGAYAVQRASTPAPVPQVPQKIRGIHRVRQGETMVSIAQLYQVSAFQIASANTVRATDALSVGQELKIPDTGQQAAGQPVKVASRDPVIPSTMARDVPVPAVRPAHRTVAAANPGPARSTASQRQSAPAQALSPRLSESAPPSRTVLRQRQREASLSTPLADPEPMAQGKFRWPVRGRIISEFGSKPNGVQNDGINIAVPAGTSIKAAENGVVAYVGNELKGYGNLILIRHDDNLVTAYAHAGEIQVQRGDAVTRGQIIGKAGQTGSVNQPQLHFEVRKNSRPVDPMTYMATSS